MTNVVRLDVVTRLDLQPDDVLTEAIGQYPGGVFIAGYDDDGHVQIASSIADGGTILWMMEVAKMRLMAIAGEVATDQ
jgi:hypothetical protein